MPKIKMITLASGPDGTRLPGKVYTVSTQEAKDLIDGGYAEQVNEPVKAAASSAPRTADKPAGRHATKKDAGEPTEDEDPAE